MLVYNVSVLKYFVFMSLGRKLDSIPSIVRYQVSHFAKVGPAWPEAIQRGTLKSHARWKKEIIGSQPSLEALKALSEWEREKEETDTDLWSFDSKCKRTGRMGLAG